MIFIYDETDGLEFVKNGECIIKNRNLNNIETSKFDLHQRVNVLSYSAMGRWLIVDMSNVAWV